MILACVLHERTRSYLLVRSMALCTTNHHPLGAEPKMIQLYLGLVCIRNVWFAGRYALPLCAVCTVNLWRFGGGSVLDEVSLRLHARFFFVSGRHKLTRRLVLKIGENY